MRKSTIVWVLALVIAVMAATSASAAPPAKCLKWHGHCWNYVTERAHFALHLDRLGVLDTFAEKHPTVAARFGPYWPPRKPQAIAAVHAAFPKELWPVADCIVDRESGWYWRAWNNVWPDDSVGLFQINLLAHKVADRIRMFDPLFNSRFAYRLYEKAEAAYGNGWWPWRGGRWPCF